MKIFEKIKKEDGKREIRLFGIKIFGYEKEKYHKITPLETIRKMGVKVGEGTKFVIHPHPWSLPDFGSEPFLVEIGNNCVISFGTTFLTHDGCVCVLRQFFKENKDIPKFGRIKIGNNCFIGCNSTILPNVTIGNNCIVGACSVVTKNIPDNEVWAGNPAHFITTTQELAQKIEEQSYIKENIELKEYVRMVRKEN